MKLACGVGAIALVLVACGPRPAPAPVASSATPPAQPDCDGAQARYEQVLAAQADAIEGEAKTQAQARVTEMHGITGQRCRDDEWSAEIATCLGAAATEDAQRTCALQMRADQHRRWFLELMTGRLPGEATADDKTGPSCVQIQASFDRLYAAQTPPAGEPTLAQRWVGQILFERCLVDGWPEPARTCFNRADVKAGCEQLLPEDARTALREHLVDMAEHLGVPY